MPEDTVVAQRHELRRKERTTDQVGQVEGQAGGDAQRAEGGDERRQLQAGDDDGVDGAEHHAGGEAGHHGQRPGYADAHERDLHHADEGHHAADRQVDAARDDDEGHAERRDRQDGSLGQDVLEVGDGREEGHELAHEQHGHGDQHNGSDGA